MTLTDNANRKAVNPTGKTEFIDTVAYTGLNIGDDYVIVGEFVIKDSGDPLVENGEKVQGIGSFTAEKHSGTAEVKFEIDVTSLEGKEIVAFETLYNVTGVPKEKLNTPKDVEENGKKITEHKDPQDDAQTIKIYKPEIGTKAVDKDTTTHVTNPGKTTIVDSVEYTDIVSNIEYELKAVLMDKATNKPLLVNGKEITNSIKFTPKHSSGTQEIELSLDATGLEGKSLVAFEELYIDGKLLAEHKDINDKNQTVTVPKIATSAKDSKTLEHITNADKITIIDTVDYEGLDTNVEYELKGVLMDKSTGKAVLVNNKQVTAIAKFKPKASSGKQEIKFTFDAKGFEGKSLVAFEELYVNNKLIAQHKDITDKEQTVRVPKIGTTAALQGKEVTDIVKYENLLEGKTYIVKGYMVNAATGLKLKGSDGETKFTADKSSGEIKVKLPVSQIDRLGGKKLVAFEELFIVTKDGKQVKVAEHKDKNDKSQTVEIPSTKTPDTGDRLPILPFGGFVIALSVLTIRVRKRIAR